MICFKNMQRQRIQKISQLARTLSNCIKAFHYLYFLNSNLNIYFLMDLARVIDTDLINF
jgi:hypothetical protein